MLRLNRYIGRTVLAAMLLVLLVIVGIDLLTALIDEANDVQGDYSFGSAMLYVLMTTPARFHEYLPFAALVGCLAGLGSLAGNSELVVMRAAGVSARRLVWAVLRPTLVLTLAGLLIGEYVAPRILQIAESYKAVALQREDRAHSEYGLWHREGDRFMHFNAVEPNGVLYGVSVYEFGAGQGAGLVRSLYARRAIFLDDYWLMEDVKEVGFGENEAEQQHFANRRWDTGLTPDLLNLIVLQPQDLATTGLWNYAKYLSEQGINAGEYELAFWNKLLQPLTIIALVMIAISFVFGPLRNVTMGQRVFAGVMVGIVFRTLQEMLGPASLVYGFPPMLASLLPVVLCLLAGAWLLKTRA